MLSKEVEALHGPERMFAVIRIMTSKACAGRMLFFDNITSKVSATNLNDCEHLVDPLP